MLNFLKIRLFLTLFDKKRERCYGCFRYFSYLCTPNGPKVAVFELFESKIQYIYIKNKLKCLQFNNW